MCRKPESTGFGPLPATKEKEGPRRIPLSAPTEKDEEKMAGVSSGKKTKRLVYSFRLLPTERASKAIRLQSQLVRYYYMLFCLVMIKYVSSKYVFS